MFQQGHVIFPLIHYTQFLSSDCMMKPQLKKENRVRSVSHFLCHVNEGGQIFIFDDVTNSG